ncbi:MAG: hypothetical protein RIT81_14600 [Deltaproteobacteria bacterium]
MTATAFRCRACGVAVTIRLEELTDPEQLEERDAQPHVPRGRYVVSDGSFFTGSEGAYLVHLEDTIHTQHHHDHGRLNGCCGLDGCDGPNTLCANGHEVGTEKSDCWMPHALLLSAEAVEPTRTTSSET